jgi:hypothetical protein
MADHKSDSKTAKTDLEKAETGNSAAARRVVQDRAADPAAVEAAEQELSEAPGRRGLSR